MVLADTLRLIGRHAEAEKECRAIIAINPLHAEAHRVLGMVLVRQGNVAEGLTHRAARHRIGAERLLSAHSSLGVLQLDLGLTPKPSSISASRLERNPKDAISR